MKNMVTKAVKAPRSLQEAYNDGFVDGLSEGYAQGYDDGYEEINGKKCEDAYTAGLTEGKTERYQLRDKIEDLERLLAQKADSEEELPF